MAYFIGGRGIQWGGNISSPSELASVIHGESNGTPASQFAVASTMYNRNLGLSGFNGPGAGSGDYSQVVTPRQFNGFNPNPDSYSQQLANDLWSGNAPSGGNPGNSVYFAAPAGGSLTGWPARNGLFGEGGGTNIGGNYFSDRMGAPSAGHIAPQYGGFDSGGSGNITYTGGDVSAGNVQTMDWTGGGINNQGFYPVPSEMGGIGGGGFYNTPPYVTPGESGISGGGFTGGGSLPQPDHPWTIGGQPIPGGPGNSTVITQPNGTQWEVTTNPNAPLNPNDGNVPVSGLDSTQQPPSLPAGTPTNVPSTSGSGDIGGGSTGNITGTGMPVQDQGLTKSVQQSGSDIAKAISGPLAQADTSVGTQITSTGQNITSTATSLVAAAQAYVGTAFVYGAILVLGVVFLAIGLSKFGGPSSNVRIAHA